MKKLFISLLLFSCQQIKSEEAVRIGPSEPQRVSKVVQAVSEPVSDSNLCTWQVRFSPNGGAEQQVVDTIKSSQDSVYMLSYSFTSEAIARALINKAEQHTVEVILDSSNKTGKGSKLNMLQDSKVIVYIDDKHAIAHNKTVVVDKLKVLTGSFNFTNAAEHNNAENSLMLTCSGLAKSYLENWNLHKSHSKRIH